MFWKYFGIDIYIYIYFFFSFKKLFCSQIVFLRTHQFSANAHSAKKCHVLACFPKGNTFGVCFSISSLWVFFASLERPCAVLLVCRFAVSPFRHSADLLFQSFHCDFWDSAFVCKTWLVPEMCYIFGLLQSSSHWIFVCFALSPFRRFNCFAISPLSLRLLLFFAARKTHIVSATRQMLCLF